mgnify:CR=1 FL=1
MSVILYENTFFQIISLFYAILIGIVFIAKKKIESVENHIFKDLVLVSIISALLDIISIISGFNLTDTFIAILFAKGYLIAMLGFCVLYTEYAIFITKNDQSNEKKLELYRSKRNIVLGVYALIALVVLIAPIYSYVQPGEIMYSYGPAVTITYIVVGICMLLWVSLLIVRVKNLAPRKALPILSIILLGGLAMLIQLFNPEIMLGTAAMIFSVVIMYFAVFTIENPDLEMVDEIKDARNTALKASQAKTDFLSNMSHELRTPLNAILGFSQGLLEKDLDNDMREDVEDIVNASDTLLELVNEILDISKIESEKLEIVENEYSTNKLYKYLVMMTEGRLGSKRLEFIHVMDKNMPNVLKGDSFRIKQIAVNLLTNAIKYTKSGYIKLEMRYDQTKGNLIISVSDTGIGMKEEDLKKIFTKFQRFEEKENNNVEGTGLGLALSKRLVDLMKGNIHVESTYGAGSTFTVSIRQEIVDKTEEELEEENIVLDIGSFKGRGQRILVVDDNPVNLKVMNRLLQNHEVILDYARSGRVCIEKVVGGNHYDLILLDDQMPEMTGKEVLKHLKNIPGFDIPTIALTANAISGMKEQYLKLGFDGYLSKPINKVLLEDILFRFLTKKENKEKKEEKEQLESETEQLEEKEEVLEENGIDLEEAVETLGGIDSFKATAKDVLEEFDNKIMDLERYKNHSDFANYHVVAHAIKGDAEYMGMTNLKELAYQHEIAGLEENGDYINSHFEELKEEILKMQEVLNEYLSY